MRIAAPWRVRSSRDSRGVHLNCVQSRSGGKCCPVLMKSLFLSQQAAFSGGERGVAEGTFRVTAAQRLFCAGEQPGHFFSLWLQTLDFLSTSGRITLSAEMTYQSLSHGSICPSVHAVGLMHTDAGRCTIRTVKPSVLGETLPVRRA